MRYPSLATFYADDPRRERSGEADFGVWWRDGYTNFPYYRVSYIHTTGEIYAIRLGGTGAGSIEVLGMVPPDPVSGPRDIYYRTLDQILDGWTEQMHQPHGLEWIRERLVNYPVGWGVR